ncbi:MAG: DNA repair protein RadC [Saccharospirillaceae bacterium]|nr:DNA repair protein RadC [Pseudomonadales bacterium]NRB78510.1 DNA repair protein RadC [Saccharospirillaceae bacterium]
MSINNWPKEQQPREKLITQGSQALSDAELLAIFLRTGIKGVSAVQLAENLLIEFGDLTQLFKADLTSFCKIKGLGSAKYAQLQAVLELSNRFFQNVCEQEPAFTKSQNTKQFLISKLALLPHEVFACMYLNNQNELIKYEELFRGTINASAVYPREVVIESLKNHASQVIFAHNHPSGSLEPSQSDKIITQRLKEALALVDITVLDHIIIGKNKAFSFAENGLI